MEKEKQGTTGAGRVEKDRSIGIQTRSEVVSVRHFRMKTERGLGLYEIDCYKEK